MPVERREQIRKKNATKTLGDCVKVVEITSQSLFGLTASFPPNKWYGVLPVQGLISEQRVGREQNLEKNKNRRQG